MNPIIQNRLQYFINRKTALLKMKKAERRDELPMVESAIHRLKRWAKELENNKS